MRETARTMKEVPTRAAERGGRPGSSKAAAAAAEVEAKEGRRTVATSGMTDAGETEDNKFKEGTRLHAHACGVEGGEKKTEYTEAPKPSSSRQRVLDKAKEAGESAAMAQEEEEKEEEEEDDEEEEEEGARKLRQATEEKEQANIKYQKGDLQGAVELWRHALKLSYELSVNPGSVRNQAAVFELEKRLQLNLAAGMLKEKSFSRCLAHCERVLQQDPTNEKALLRMAQAYIELQDWTAARAAITRLQQQQGEGCGAEAAALLKKLQQDEALHAQQERALWKNMLQSHKAKQETLPTRQTPKEHVSTAAAPAAAGAAAAPAAAAPAAAAPAAASAGTCSSKGETTSELVDAAATATAAGGGGRACGGGGGSSREGCCPPSDASTEQQQRRQQQQQQRGGTSMCSSNSMEVVGPGIPKQQQEESRRVGCTKSKRKEGEKEGEERKDERSSSSGENEWMWAVEYRPAEDFDPELWQRPHSLDFLLDECNFTMTRALPLTILYALQQVDMRRRAAARAAAAAKAGAAAAAGGKGGAAAGGKGGGGGGGAALAAAAAAAGGGEATTAARVAASEADAARAGATAAAAEKPAALHREAKPPSSGGCNSAAASSSAVAAAAASCTAAAAVGEDVSPSWWEALPSLRKEILCIHFIGATTRSEMGCRYTAILERWPHVKVLILVFVGFLEGDGRLERELQRGQLNPPAVVKVEGGREQLAVPFKGTYEEFVEKIPGVLTNTACTFFPSFAVLSAPLLARSPLQWQRCLSLLFEANTLCIVTVNARSAAADDLLQQDEEVQQDQLLVERLGGRVIVSTQKNLFPIMLQAPLGCSLLTKKTGQHDSKTNNNDNKKDTPAATDVAAGAETAAEGGSLVTTAQQSAAATAVDDRRATAAAVAQKKEERGDKNRQEKRAPAKGGEGGEEQESERRKDVETTARKSREKERQWKEEERRNLQAEAAFLGVKHAAFFVFRGSTERQQQQHQHRKFFS